MCCPLYGGDDCEGPEFFTQKIYTAKKDYHCCECSEAISASTKYEKTVGKWDGSLDTFRTCLSCMEIRDHFNCGSGFLFQELWSQLEENFFPDMKAGGPCMKGLSPEAKDRLFARRMAWYEDKHACGEI